MENTNKTMKLQPEDSTSGVDSNGVKKTKGLVWVLGIVILIGVGYGAYWFGQNQKPNIKSQNSISKVNQDQTKLKVTELIPTESTTPVVTKITDPGVTWLAKPEKVNRLNLLKDEGDYVYYYKIADLQGGGEIYYVAAQEMGTTVYRFRKTVDNKYYLLKNHSDSYPTDGSTFFNSELYKSSKIETDYNTKYISLLPPDLIKIGSLSLNKNNFFMSFDEFFDIPIGDRKNTASNPPNDGKVSKIGSIEYGDIYKIEAKQGTKTDNGHIKDVRYFVVLADGSVKYYAERIPILGDDGSFIGTFDQVNLNNKRYSKGLSANGCGYGNEYQYDTTLTQDRVKKIGLAKEGGLVYVPTSNEDAIYKIAYETYKVGRENDINKHSYESFIKQTPVLIWKSPGEYYYLFMDKDFAPLAECGKPVIYLYPTTSQKVSVKVGADVTVSEPKYKNGWDVLAKPSGELTWSGKKFDSLYWEGKGQGVYPAIAQGRVVETKNIEQELRGDLTKLGLNTKESQDFIDFWLLKMPMQTYTRLTWFGTKQMDELAPLTIIPKPDTSIRIFLDFAGQDSPQTNLLPQKLSSIPRTGFTVVEWGGLLIGKK